MNAKASLIKHLLAGEVLNIKNCFTIIGLTNAPREISRMVEKPFNVIVSRTHRTGKTRYGTPCCWTDYRLNQTDYNKEGIKKMFDYVKEQEGTITTDKQQKQIEKIEKKVNNIYNQTPLL